MDDQKGGTDDRTPRDETAGNGRFRLHEHPWLVVVVVPAVSVGLLLVRISVVGTLGLPESPSVRFLEEVSSRLVFLLVIAPFVLRLPSGRQPLVEYLDEIRLTRIQPLGRLLALALSCYLLLALSQIIGVVVYRLTRGEPLTVAFLVGAVDVSGDLPPGSWSLLVALPSALEEVTFRGVLLFTLLGTLSKRRAVVASAAAFGLVHLVNLAFGRELVWVLGQVGWTFLLGLFYADIVLRTDSLLPAMVIHYLGNAFIGSLTWYIQQTGPVEVQAAYGLVFTLGLVPVVLMTAWARYYTSRWLPSHRALDSHV